MIDSQRLRAFFEVITLVLTQKRKFIPHSLLLYYTNTKNDLLQPAGVTATLLSWELGHGVHLTPGSEESLQKWGGLRWAVRQVGSGLYFNNTAKKRLDKKHPPLLL